MLYGKLYLPTIIISGLSLFVCLFVSLFVCLFVWVFAFHAQTLWPIVSWLCLSYDLDQEMVNVPDDAR